MMMFTRLKIRPVETILFVVTFNLVAVTLVAIKAARLSPEILGFSVAAAVSACIAIVLIATHIDGPLRRLTNDAFADRRSDISPASGDLARQDEIGQLAREIERLRRQPAANHTALSEGLARLEDSLRRLSNGELSCLVYDSLPAPLDGLRVRLNRLASMLNVNLSAAHRNTTALREQARSSQADLAVIGGRITGALPTAQKASGAIEGLHRAAHLRHDDAQAIARRLTAMASRGQDVEEASVGALAANDAASSAVDALTRLAHDVGTLTIKAERLVSILENPQRPALDATVGEAACLARELADAGITTTQDLLIHCREADDLVSDSTRNARRLQRDASALADTVRELSTPAERLARNADLEVQQLSLARLAVTETETVLARTQEIIQASDTAMTRIMSEASAIDTRLSLFTFISPAKPGRPQAGDRSHLRSIT